jgi:hypothetical protein
MAVTANQPIRRRGTSPRIRKVPVAASTILYEGTLCFEDAGGDFTGTVLEGGTFGGIVRKMVDNSGGADASAGGFGAKWAEVYVDTEFLLPFTGTDLVVGDIGKPAYASDNYTLTEVATDLVPVGVITEVVSTSLAWVSIHGLGVRDTGPLVT